MMTQDHAAAVAVGQVATAKSKGSSIARHRFEQLTPSPRHMMSWHGVVLFKAEHKLRGGRADKT
jgi:hypothetical protein